MNEKFTGNTGEQSRSAEEERVLNEKLGETAINTVEAENKQKAGESEQLSDKEREKAIRDLRKEIAHKRGQIDGLKTVQANLSMKLKSGPKSKQGRKREEFEKNAAKIADLEKEQGELEAQLEKLSPLSAEVDRFGNPAYSDESIETLTEEAEQGEVSSPAEEQRQEAIEAAQADADQRERESIERILNGRTLQQAKDDIEASIQKLENGRNVLAESANSDPQSADYYQQKMDEADDDIAELQKKLVQLEAYSEKTGESTGESFGIDMAQGGGAEMWNNYEASQTNYGYGAPQASYGYEEAPQASYGVEASPIMEDPGQNTQDKVMMSAAEFLTNILGDPSILERAEEVYRQHQAETQAIWEQQTPTADVSYRYATVKTPAGTESLYQAPVIPETSTEEYAQAEAAMQGAAEQVAEEVSAEKLEAAEKVRLIDRIRERMAERRGMLRRLFKPALATVGAGIMLLTFSACEKKGVAPAGAADDPEIQAAYSDYVSRPNSGQESAAESNSDDAGQINSFDISSVLSGEDVGDVTKDLLLENEFGVKFSYDEFLKFCPNGMEGTIEGRKLKNVNFGLNHSEDFGNREAALEHFYAICRDMPEALATNITCFPSIMKEAGLRGDETPQEIDALFSSEQGGGALQEKLLAGLKKALDDPNTKVDFERVTGDASSWWVAIARGEGVNPTPSEIDITFQAQWNIKDAAVTKVSVPLYDADGGIVGYEIGMYSMSCGYQKIIINSKGEIVEITPNDEPENPNPNPEKPTPNTPTPNTPTPDTPTPPGPNPSPDPEKPTPPTPTEETPDPNPKPDPNPTPNPEPETPKAKDPANIINNGLPGAGDGNTLTQTPDFNDMPEEDKNKVGDGGVNPSDIIGDTTGVYAPTEEPVIPESPAPVENGGNNNVEQVKPNEEVKIENSVPDSTLTPEQQEQQKQEIEDAEKRAEEAANNTPTTPEGIDDFYQQLMNSMNNGA